jgi:hypothetical protein
MRVVYIIGAQRGGTTIVGRVLGAATGMAFAGELRILWAARESRPNCGCGLSRQACPIWSQVLTSGDGIDGASASELDALREAIVPTSGQWKVVSRVLDTGFAPNAELDRYSQALHHLYESWAEASGVHVVVDSSKYPAEALVLRQVPGIEPVFVHVVRDPRGVVYSRMRRRTSGGGSHPRFAFDHAMSWRRRYLAGEQIVRSAGPERAITIPYEDFIDDPVPRVAAVAALAGVDVGRPVLPTGSGDRIRLPVAHTPVADGRYRDPEDVELHDRQEWRDRLHPLDRRIIEAVTSSALRERYERGRRLAKPSGKAA